MVLVHNSFPKNIDLAKQWRAIISMNGNQIQENVNSIKGRICIEHFTDDDFVNKNSEYVQLKRTATPSIFNVFNHFDHQEINDVSQKQTSRCIHHNHCKTCEASLKEKNDRIETLKSNHVANMQRIQFLEKKLNDEKLKLNKCRDKYYNLNRTKIKLRAVIEELKKK